MNKRIKADLRRSELITKPQYGDKRPADSTRWMSSKCSGFGQFILISMATTLMLDGGREKLAVEKLVANFAPNQWCLPKNHEWKEWDFFECNACLSADDCFFLKFPAADPPKLQAVCPNPSHERPTSRPKGPHHRPAPSGDLAGTEERLTLKVGVCSHTSVFLSFSVFGKMRLCTQRRILTIK